MNNQDTHSMGNLEIFEPTPNLASIYQKLNIQISQHTRKLLSEFEIFYDPLARHDKSVMTGSVVNFSQALCSRETPDKEKTIELNAFLGILKHHNFFLKKTKPFSLMSLTALEEFSEDKRLSKDKSVKVLQEKVKNSLDFEYCKFYIYHNDIEDRHNDPEQITLEIIDFFKHPHVPKKAKKSLLDFMGFRLRDARVDPVFTDYNLAFFPVFNSLDSEHFTLQDYMKYSSSYSFCYCFYDMLRNFFDCSSDENEQKELKEKIDKGIDLYCHTIDTGLDQKTAKYRNFFSPNSRLHKFLDNFEGKIENKPKIQRFLMLTGAMLTVAPLLPLGFLAYALNQIIDKQKEKLLLSQLNLNNSLEKAFSLWLIPHFERLGEDLQKKVLAHAISMAQTPLVSHMMKTGVAHTAHTTNTTESSLQSSTLPESSNNSSSSNSHFHFSIHHTIAPLIERELLTSRLHEDSSLASPLIPPPSNNSQSSSPSTKLSNLVESTQGPVLKAKKTHKI